MNPDTVRQERGEPIYFGDATQEPVLKRAGIDTANVIVITVPDAASAKRITDAARRHNPAVYIIVRTRYILEMKSLYNLGADEVIPEEYETSIEIFARVLTKFLVPRNEIERLIEEIRSDGYEMFRSLSLETLPNARKKIPFPDFEISAVKVEHNSLLEGKTLSDAALNTRHKVIVVAVERNRVLKSTPSGATRLEANDTLYVIGKPENIASAAPLFRSQNE
jgi:CPA2 family monovalent cation:H+ antiporter-2